MKSKDRGKAERKRRYMEERRDRASGRCGREKWKGRRRGRMSLGEEGVGDKESGGEGDRGYVIERGR